MTVSDRLKSWEGLLLAGLIAIVIMNVLRSPYYLGVGKIVNLFQLSIEKIIVALVMTLIIINGEIDLSVASVMGLAAHLEQPCEYTGGKAHHRSNRQIDLSIDDD